MADHLAVASGLEPRPGVVYSALTPNLRGYEAARAAGIRRVAVFAAASEAFSRKNTNCSIAESLKRFEKLLAAAKQHGIAVSRVRFVRSRLSAIRAKYHRTTWQS